MEQTDLYYNGITRTPSDHACKLGDLAECVNLISQNNEIEPISTPPILLQCDGELLFIHKSSTYHNFIVNQNGVLKAFSQTTSGIEYYPFTMNISKLGTIYNTSCLGNTLILLCAKGIYYLLFKNNDYKLLGQKPPFIPLSFGLKGTLVQSEEFTIDIDNQPSSQSDFTENNVTIVTNEVIHRANKLIAENSTTAGKFIYPFFVRYAFRLYDLLQCDGELLFIHKSSTYHNFIVNQNGVLKAFSQTTSGIEYYPFTMNISKLGTIYNTSCLGNTLILLCAKGIYYLLFKNNDYKLLGQKPPFIPLSFGLKGTLVQSEEFTIDIDNQPSSQSDFTENNVTIVTNEVIHRANKLIAENSTTAGKFIYPFFVRYAFRLYDDSLIMHSAPVLMIPSTVMAPLATTEITYTGPTQSASIDKLKTRLQAHACTLDYLYTGDNTSYQELQKWNDIIKSIDIFLSEPIYTYDQNGKCSGG